MAPNAKFQKNIYSFHVSDMKVLHVDSNCHKVGYSPGNNGYQSNNGNDDNFKNIKI